MILDNYVDPTPILVDTASRLKPGKALDIGSAYGRNSIFLAKSGWEVYALDIDANAIEYIHTESHQNNLNIKTYQGSLQSCEITEEFDLIACLMVLHFLSEKEIHQTIDWMKRHTTPGGINIISVFTDKNKVGTRPYLFKDNELSDQYSDWSIRTYQENNVSSVNVSDQKASISYYVTRLVVSKNKS